MDIRSLWEVGVEGLESSITALGSKDHLRDVLRETELAGMSQRACLSRLTESQPPKIFSYAR
jgi:hypothetical protein